MSARLRFGGWAVCGAVLASGTLWGQTRPAAAAASELRLRVVSPSQQKQSALPAVVWLEPLGVTSARPFRPHGVYKLLQKNRTFTPHLQIIPVGSVVEFPNEDPFFHNVFSLFDGKRFNLGLYEAGSSRSVTFSRAGVSYIFCNIHPEMSAVVITLDTPLYAVANPDESFLIRDVPSGEYSLHVWIEGVRQSALDSLTRTVRFPPRIVDLGTIKAPVGGTRTMPHLNLYGKAYSPQSESPYSEAPY